MDDPKTPRPQRQQFNSRVRFVVADRQTISERFATNLSEGGLFVQDDNPPAVGSLILIEFVLPDGKPLSRVAARVVHSRPGVVKGDKTAGMGLRFVELDAVAAEIGQQLNSERARPSAPGDGAAVEQPRQFSLQPLPAPLLAPSGPVIGIDLGTVNSCVAIVNKGTPRVILSPQGYDTIPSVVFVASDGNVFVGHKALERMILDPTSAIYGSKRFLGRPFISREVQTYGHFFNYELVAGRGGRTAAKVGAKTIGLEEVAGHILRKMRDMAEHALGRSVGRAVVTVPAYFGETQRMAVREAGRLAGLNVERILNEPTAAAVAYGFGRRMQKTILVYDLGGGTFDATVLRIENDSFEVLATDGDPFLGGADFDDRLTEYVLSTFERTRRVSLREDAVAVQRLRFAVELAKRQLSEAMRVDLDLPYIAQTADGPVHLRMPLERALFERLTQDLVDRTLTIVQAVLDQAKIKSADLDDVLLVGGQSRTPMVRARLVERFNRRPSAAVHPTEAVALGAALIAEALHSELAVHLADILPASVRLGQSDGTTLLLWHRGVRLPVAREIEVAAEPGRAEIRVLLFRGENALAADNTFLGAITFPPIASSAAITARARVKIQITSDGILRVTAVHPVTGEHKELDLLLSDA
ncbi:MAG: Hsp70 family protein [Deltaproteobacteria bacterium]|nr:Hsp70 family protein [Deltaproteobacteria bacterium]